MFSFGKRPSVASPGGGNATDFTRILTQWTEATRRANVQLPSQAIHEIKKRIKTPGKPKLDFFKCGLDDRMVTALVEILSDSPVIGKLDLGANYTSDQSAISLIRLLILQAKQVRETPVDQRLTAVYIGEVSFDHSKSVIQDKVLEDIATVSGALRHANMKTVIRQCYVKFGTDTAITVDAAASLYQEATGRKAEKPLLTRFEQAAAATQQQVRLPRLDRSLPFASRRASCGHFHPHPRHCHVFSFYNLPIMFSYPTHPPPPARRPPGAAPRCPTRPSRP